MGLHSNVADVERPHVHEGGGPTLWVYDQGVGACHVWDGVPPLEAQEQPAIEIPEHWTFKDASVAAGFNRHVREQLPWYDLVSDAIVQIAAHYLGDGGQVMDVGASNGNIGRRMDSLLQDRHASILSVEPSSEMVAKFCGPGEVVNQPIQEVDFPPETYDVIVANLVLMFLRPDEQGVQLQRLQRGVKHGGALILVERMIPPSGYLSIVSSRLTLAAKLKAGVTPDEILTKELSLAGSQRPVDARLLLAHGAHEWFRYGDFAGWVITKELPHRS